MDPSPLAPLPPTFAAALASLHRVAEELVAPARKPDNEIALTATPSGFGTPEFEHEGERQQVRVEGAELVRRIGDEERRAPLTTLAAGAEAIADLLPAGSEPGAEPLDIDPAATEALGRWYAFAEALLERLVSEAAPAEEASPPNLWPEHFDIAIELGSESDGLRANYGASPGDEDHAEPYLYVGPWTAKVEGDLWRATGFAGADMAYAELLSAADQAAAALEFFTERRDDLAGTGRSEE
jgi:hypothetical protein